MTPNITGPKTLSIDEGGVAEFFETVDGELSSKFNVFFGAEDSADLQSTIRLRVKIEVDGVNSEPTETPGIIVTGASLNEDAESSNYGYYVLSHIDDLKTLSVQFADEQRSGEINVTIEAYQDFVAGSEFVFQKTQKIYENLPPLLMLAQLLMRLLYLVLLQALRLIWKRVGHLIYQLLLLRQMIVGRLFLFK